MFSIMSGATEKDLTMKKKIAIITGGNVAERGISLKSAKTIAEHLDKERYNVFVIELEGTEFYEQKSRTRIDKNDFSLPRNEEPTIHFDLAFPMLHGHPAEDGCLQGYFDIIGLPYTGCDHFVSALTFNKQACKDYLLPFDIPMADSVLLHKGQQVNGKAAQLEALGLPVFVKPNKNGSSYGVTKVTENDQLSGSIHKAFDYDEEVIVEQFLSGGEFSVGVVRKDSEIVVLPVTEIVPQHEFFDYKAKYENESEEITPARLSDPMTRKCQQLSYDLYKILNCKGMVRFDYILVGDIFYFLEANTIPGMSEQSIVPQQALAHGWTIGELLDAVVGEV